MANKLESLKNIENLKSLQTNLLHRGPLKTTLPAACGPRVGQPWPKPMWRRGSSTYNVEFVAAIED